VIAGKWMDMVVGVDIHFVLVPTPAGPVPTPLPHPFVGIVYDPVGLVVGAAFSAAFAVILGAPFTGPVLINGLPAANTGIQGTNKPVMPHVPMPPGTAWAMVPSAPKPPIPGRPPSPPSPAPTPQNDASMITGSKTVFISGTNACRLGDLAMSCAEPIRLPSSTCIAIPMGMPVLIGGPPALDFMAALMSMIRTKWVSDQLHALFRAKPGSWASKIICFFTGHPVDVASGMVVTDHVDFAVPGTIATIFDRTYFSRSTYDGPLGRGWGYRYDQFIRVERRRVVLHAGDGREIYFYPDDSRWPVWNSAERLALSAVAGGFAVAGADGLTRTFAGCGRLDGALSLTTIEDRDGNRIRLSYDRSGGLERITDAEERVFDLERDAAGRVVAIHAPHPDGAGRQVVVSRFAYDAHGDLIAASDALGNTFRYTYVNHLLVQETDPTGHSFYFAYDGADHDAWCVRTWGDGGVFDRELTYDKARGITVVEDSLGHATTYFANEAGLIVKQIDPCGGIQEFEWVDGHLVKHTNAVGGTSQFEFDDRGWLAAATDPLGGERRYERDEAGRCVALRDPTGARWAFGYGRGLRPTEFTPPAGGTARHEHDDRGNITSATDGEGRVYRFSRARDRDGGLTVNVSNPAGFTRVLRYDAWGRLRILQDGDGSRYDLTYDLTGCLTQVQLPDQRQLRYEYDANRRRITEHLPDGTRLSYRYGPFSKIAEGTDGHGTTVRFDRDTEGRLTRLVRADGRSHVFRYDGCGRAVETIGFDGRTRTNRYDLAGRRVASTDGLGRPTIFKYDANDQLTAITGWDGYEAAYAYGPTGLLLAAKNGDASVEFERDAAGRVVAERNGPFTLRWEFDRAGVRIARRFDVEGFEGRVAYELDAVGDVREHVSRSGRVALERDPVHRRVRTRLLSGLTLDESFDAFARPLSQRTANQRRTGEVVRRRYTYDESGALAARFEGGRGETRFEHDRSHNLTAMHGRDGRLEFWRDGAGRLITNGPQSFVLDEAGRVLRANEETFEYDVDGCMTQRTETRTGRRTRYSYDSLFRLRRVTLFDGNPRAGLATGEFSAVEPDSTREPDEVVEFDYDAFGRRIAKRTATTETRYAWDGLRLALEWENPLGSAPQEPWEYHFHDRSFVALYRTKSSRFEFFIPDQVGAPREVINSTGDIVWRGTIAPYGSILNESGPARRPTMRLPGQYADAETGLSYNGARYYDPSLGRYITPDPIGIHGSLDTYAYAGDPLAFIDPWALYIVALGRTNSPGNPTLLKDFAAAHPPSTTWGGVPNLPEPHEVGWGQWAHDLIGNSEGAHFNLTGINDLPGAYKNGQQLVTTEAMLAERGLSPALATSSGARVTDAEIYQLLRRDGPLDDKLKHFWDEKGNEVDIETLRKQCGI
jgi:RHS repeat-associated protein